MAEERDEEKFGKSEDRQKQQQTTGGQQSHENEYGRQGSADGQAGSTIAGDTDQQELGELGGEVDQPGSFAGGMSGRQAEIQGEGFIARPSTDTDEYLQDTDDRQGAIENPPPTRASDVERERDRNDEDSNIEGGVG